VTFEATFDVLADGAHKEGTDDIVSPVEDAAVETSADEQPERVPWLPELIPFLLQQARRPKASFSESENLLPGEERGIRGTDDEPVACMGMGGSSGVEESSCLSPLPGNLEGCGEVPEPNLGGGGLPVPKCGGGGLMQVLPSAGLPENLSESFIRTGLFVVEGAGLLSRDGMVLNAIESGLSLGRGDIFTGVLILGPGLILAPGLPNGRGGARLVRASRIARRRNKCSAQIKCS